MNLEQRALRVLERDRAERRVLGAFRFVDAMTGAPVAVAAAVDARLAVMPGIPTPVPLPEHAVQIRQNRQGIFVIFRAPFFDTYISTFDAPQPPAELTGEVLGIRVSVADAGPHYLPQEFQIDIPRSTDPKAADNVFTPVRVRLYRAPSAPVLDGWAVLRVSVTKPGNAPRQRLGGVLVRAFRANRANGETAIGTGMTDWRGTAVGEAVVPVQVPRFRAGAGNGNVIETTQDLELELTRNPQFVGAPGQQPDAARLDAAAHPLFVVPGSADATLLRPDAPLRVRAGREQVVELTMP